MVKLQWIITRIVERIGLLGFINIVLIALIYVVCVYSYLPKQQLLTNLQKQHDKKPVKVTNTITRYQSPADSFFASLPVVNDVPTQLKLLFEQAKHNTILINEVQYKEQQLQGNELIRYDITFSVFASYPQIKAFIADVLVNLPSLALEQVSFNRDEPSVDTVTTQLRFSLFMVKK